MSRSIPDELTRAMEEAATLAPDDPRRQAVIERVRDAGPAAEAAWLELVDQTERLRLELRRIEVPSGLERDLLELPAAHPRHRQGRVSALRRAAVVVAILALVFGVWFGAGPWLGRSEAPASSEAMQHVAALTIRDHRNPDELSVRSKDRDTVAAALRDRTNMPVHLPRLNEQYQLMGGRICELDGQRVIYTRWRRAGRTHSLYQLQRGAFGLPETFAARRMETPAVPGAPTPHELVLWPGKNCVYVMVCDEGGAAPGDRHAKGAHVGEVDRR